MRARFWIGAIVLVGLGVAAGIIGERTRWFGLAKHRLMAADCQALSVNAPYDAWSFRMERDGSAVLVSGVGRNPHDVGFNPLATVLGLLQGGQPRCAFPAGSFDFDAHCRELLQKRQPQSDALFLDYPVMSSRLVFTPISKDWLEPAKREQYDLKQLQGSLAPGEGQKLIEVARDKAVSLQLWHKGLEDIWPYPPIPWGFHGQSRPVPKKLRVQRPVMLREVWEGFMRDEALMKAAPEPANLGLGSAGFVTDEAVWSKLWLAWRGDADVPKVDFKKDLVLVFALRGWSKLGTPLMPLDKGELTAVQPVGTESQGGAGFVYHLGTLPRAGITSVNRVALERK